MDRESSVPIGESGAAENASPQPEGTPEAGEASLESVWREKLAESQKVAGQVNELTESIAALDTSDVPMDEGDRTELADNKAEAEALVQAEADLGEEMKRQAGQEAEGEGGAMKASIGDLLAAKLEQQKQAGQQRIEPSQGVRAEEVAAAAGLETPAPDKPEPGNQRISPLEGVRAEDVAAAAGLETPAPDKPEPDWKAKMAEHADQLMDGFVAEDAAAEKDTVAKAIEEGLLDKDAPIAPDLSTDAAPAPAGDSEPSAPAPVGDSEPSAPAPAGDSEPSAPAPAGDSEPSAPAPDQGAERPTSAVKDSAEAVEASGDISQPEKGTSFDYELGSKVVLSPEMKQAVAAEEARQREAAAEAIKLQGLKEAAAETRRNKLEELGSHIADRLAQLKRFEGLGTAKLLSGKNRRERQLILDDLAQSKKEYAEVRAEAVGENLRLALDERMEQAERQREAMEREKGFSTQIYDAFKKLGELNLTKLGWKPKGRFGQMVARAASVRTAISLGLLGGGLALGGATSAAGLGAIGLRRLMGGMGAGVGSYDLMRMVADRRAGNFSAEELEKMDESEVSQRMAKLESRAAVGGVSLRGNAAYDQLRQRFERIHGTTAAEQAAGKPFAEMTAEERMNLTPDQLLEMAERPKGAAGRVAALMEATDGKLADRARQDKRNDRIMKGVAAGLAVTVGSGAMAKGVGWLSEKGGISGAFRSAKEAIGQWLGLESAPISGAGAGTMAAETPPAEAPPAETPRSFTPESPLAEAPPAAGSVTEAPGGAPPAEAPLSSAEAVQSPESLAKSAKLAELAQVQKGDNYYKIIGRQLQADPERFGYNPATDGEPDKWAKKMTGQIVRQNKLIGQGWDQRLRFDPNNPGSVELKYDAASGKFSLDQSAESYRNVQPDPDQILKESVEATRQEMDKTALTSAESFEPKQPAWAKDVLSPQDQMRATAKAWQEAGITKDSLEKLIEATAGQKEVVLTTADGKVLRVPVDIETKRAAVEALEKMGKGGDASLTPETAPGQPMPGEASVDTGKRWVNEGVTRESLEKLAKSPAVGGELKSLKTVDGRTIVVDGGTDAKLAANAALDQLDAREAAAAAGKKAAETAAEQPTQPVTETKDAFGGFYSDQQKALGKSWIDRGVTKESLEALANAPARGGEFLDLKTADGGTVRVAGGFDAQRAAKSALEQLKNK